MAITDWPLEQRPRERLLTHGPTGLTDAELLALVLRVGVAGKSAVHLAAEMVDHFGSLNALFSATFADFSAIRGLGPAKFTLFQAVRELARRSLAEDLALEVCLDSPVAVKQYLRLIFAGKTQEIFVVLFLNVQNQLIGCEEMFRGSLTHTTVYPREIARAALKYNAAALILAHNHPSGNAKPSKSDLSLTLTLQRALALVDVRILDHFVIADKKIHSFAEHGQMSAATALAPELKS